MEILLFSNIMSKLILFHNEFQYYNSKQKINSSAVIIASTTTRPYIRSTSSTDQPSNDVFLQTIASLRTNQLFTLSTQISELKSKNSSTREKLYY